MKHLDGQTKAVLVTRLREKRAAGLAISADVRRAAAALLVTERTVWRWINQAETDETPGRRVRRQYSLSQAELDDYATWRGNVAAARRALIARGAADVPSLRTLQRAFVRELSPAQRAGVAEGVEGWRRHQVYLRWTPERRNALWEGDHKELPVLVVAPRAQHPRKPWATLFVDAYSRLIMGWALSMTPNAATVLAALRRGLVVDPARGPFGGVPDRLRPDRGLEFVNTAVARSAAALGVELVPTPAYTPYAKGKVERANLTLDQEFLSGLPFYTEGPRAADGHLFGPDAAPMGLELFCDRFAAWVIDYNTVRVHSELEGQTPLQRWCGDASPVREVATEALRWMLMADAERTINKDGVHFRGVRFIAAELTGLVGERVQVRYTPHDLRQIEVFRGDTWLATAYPQDLLSAQQRDAVLERRRADAAELGRRQRRASRRARAQLAPMTQPGPVVEVTTVTEPQAAGERRSRRESDLQRLASTDLLNLHTDFSYWNPDVAPVVLDTPDEADVEVGTEPSATESTPPPESDGGC